MNSCRFQQVEDVEKNNLQRRRKNIYEENWLKATKDVATTCDSGFNTMLNYERLHLN